MKKYLKPLAFALLGFLLVAQFFPIDKTNPPADPSKDFITMTNPPAAVAENIKAACYDCHSHHVKYPWYTNVAPISWWVKGHIDHGTKHLNFSIWGDYSEKKKDHKLDECVEFVEKNWMPILTYKMMHSEGRLTEAEREEMISFFKRLKG